MPESLAGGVTNAGEVVRAGDIVLRPAPPNAATLRRLLRHVVAQGFIAPEPVDEDGNDREAFRYIPGKVSLHPYPESWVRSDRTLVDLGLLLRSYHAAVQGFKGEHADQWSTELADPAGGDLICHNDVCIENVVFGDRGPIGLLDFDFAAPGRPIWDVVMAARYWVPLLDPISAVTTGRADLDVFARLRLLADGYELSMAERQSFGSVLLQAEEVALRFVLGRIEQGDAAFARMWTELGGEARHRRKMTWLEQQLDRIEATLAG